MVLEKLREYGFQHISEVHTRAVHEVDQRRKGLIKPYKTKWEAFNRELGGGIQIGNVYVIGARPGLGKSAFSNRLIFDLCELNDMSNTIILYWNFEMANYQQIIREASSKLNMSYNRLMSSEQSLQEEHFFAFKNLKDSMLDFPIYFMDRNKSAKFIYETNKQLKDTFQDFDFINLMDHTRLIAKSTQKASEEERITELLSYGRDLTVDTEATTIFLSQLNRNIESPQRAATLYIPQLTDFFGSDAVGQFAHTAMILQRPEMYNIEEYLDSEPAEGLIANHILKNRNGSVTWIPFQHDLAHNKIWERSKPDPNEPVIMYKM